MGVEIKNTRILLKNLLKWTNMLSKLSQTWISLNYSVNVYDTHICTHIFIYVNINIKQPGSDSRFYWKIKAMYGLTRKKVNEKNKAQFPQRALTSHTLELRN